MPNILAVGIATIDIINEVDNYPKEDSEIRALNQLCQRGGNATNTLVLLSQLGHNCFWAGTMADDINVKVITSDLDSYHIDFTNTRCVEHATNPTSYIIHSNDTASRSIVHYRDLEEYDINDFKQIKLDNFDWIHFEGRNIENVFLMQQFCKRNFPHIKISVEIEKVRTQIEKLFEYADVILFSRPYAVNSAYKNAEEFLLAQQINFNNKILSCTWGDKGASLSINGRLFSQPAYRPDKVIDTLAAGDTYNAAIIHALLETEDLSKANGEEILYFSCKIAGEKCAQRGISSFIKA